MGKKKGRRHFFKAPVCDLSLRMSELHQTLQSYLIVNLFICFMLFVTVAIERLFVNLDYLSACNGGNDNDVDDF